MRLPYAALLLSIACSSPEPRPSTLERGTYRPPVRAPTFQPHERAPHHTGQPGHLRPVPQVQPNPKHKRYLPQTNEPGIWASEGDPSGGARPMVLHVPIPVPEPDGEITEESKKPAADCAKSLTTAMVQTNTAWKMLALPPKDQQCLAARLYFLCAKDTVEYIALEARMRPGTISEKVYERYKATHDLAMSHRDRTCTDDQDRDPAIQAVVDEVMRQWYETFRDIINTLKRSR